MYVKYGAFAFEGYEAGMSLHIESVRSDRGFQKTRKVRFDIEGEVCENGQYDVTTRLQEIHAAFDLNYQDIGLYHDNDAPTVHVLRSNHVNNLTGNQVRTIDFPTTVGGEYVTGRKFRFVVDAEVAAAESNVVEYFDSIEFNGNAGERWQWESNPQWGYYPIKTAPTSLQRIVHRGRAVGMYGRIFPPLPYYSPPFEDNIARTVKFTTGKRHPQGYTELVTEWSYIYTLPVANDLLRPTLA